MNRYRFVVEYLGSPFAGWQLQPGQPTVQSELEKALAICLRAEIRLVGAGRTDSGVHASGQVAHFEYPESVDLRRIEGSVNALTPDSIFIRRLEPCSSDFHARFSALSRLYRYRIALRPTALLSPITWFSGFNLDIEKMRAELADSIGQYDFVNFSVPRDDGKSTLCQVLQANVQRTELAGGDCLVVTLEANRFLHRMVRSLVGASFDVARGARSPGLIRQILAGTFAGERTWAPAKGLSLEKVKYADYEY